MTATFGPNGKTNLTYCSVAAAGPSRSDSNPPQQPPSGGASAGVSEYPPHCLQWPPSQEEVALATLLQERRSTSSPGGGSKAKSGKPRPARCFQPKGPFYEAAGGLFVNTPSAVLPKTRVFRNVHSDPSKTRCFGYRIFVKHDKTRGFGPAQVAKRRTGRLQTVFFCSWSLLAAPCHQEPRSV